MSCSVKGIVLKVDDSKAYIEIEPARACLACAAKSLCGSGDSKEVIVKNNKKFKVGDEINISINSKLLITVSLLLYLPGLILAFLFSYASVGLFYFSEIVAAFVFILVVAIYIPIASRYLTKLVVDKIKYKTLDAS